MTAKQFLGACALFILCSTSSITYGQKILYNGISVPVTIPPSYPQYKDYQTYDVAVIPGANPEDTRLKKYDELPYELTVGDLKKSGSGDFHVVATLYSLNGKLTSKSTASINIVMYVNVFDKYGNVVKAKPLNRENFYISLGKKLTDEEIANKDLVNTILIQNSIDTALSSFTRSIVGYTTKADLMFAYLRDVKKYPELDEFSEQMKNVYRASQTNDTKAVVETMKSYVPYWEKMSTYSGEGDANEVKRAAYHNLILYYTLAGDVQKAKEYIEPYKAVDKVISAAFGLVKVKYSEESEKNLDNFYPTKTIAVSNEQKPVTLAELVEKEKYISLNGEITLKGKRKPGTYNGAIKISKIMVSGESGNIVSLDKPGDDVFITTTDGQKFSITSSDIESIKVNDQELYTYKVQGAVMGVGGIGTIMKTSYVSPKIIVYRSFFPEGNDYYILKAGDTEGIVKSPLKARKKLADYLSDCPELSKKIKDGVIGDDVKEEKIAEEYTNCKQ